MNNIVVNVVFLGKEILNNALDNFIDKIYSSLNDVPKLFKKKIGFALRKDENRLILLSGHKRKHESIIEFISSPLTKIINEHEKEEIKKWSDSFSILVIVCDSEESFNNFEVLNHVLNYRLTMTAEGRYSDTIILMKNVQNIVSIHKDRDYCTTMIGVCSAFASVQYNKSALIPEFNEQWRGIKHTYFLQTDVTFRTQISNKKMAIVPFLLINFAEIDSSGYIELLQIILNKSLREQNHKLREFTNNYIYNKTFIDMKLICNVVGKIIPKKKISLAVIGGTSQGKTYFLIDLANQIFTHGSPVYLTDSQNFESPHAKLHELNTLNFKGGVQQTTTDTNGKLYISKVKNDKGSYLLEMMDIPGEIFMPINDENTNGTIHHSKFFSNVYNAIRDSGLRFKIIYFRQGDNKYKFVYPCDLLDKELTDDDQKIKDNFDSAIKDVKDLNYKEYIPFLAKISKNKSGRDLINEYDTYYEPSVKLAIEYICKKSNDKDLFSKYYTIKDEFKYFFFIKNATDILVCHRFASTMQLGNEKDYNIDNLHTQLKAYISNDRPTNDRPNIYLMLRGVDAIMHKENWEQLYNSLSRLNIDRYKKHDILYSLLLEVLDTIVQNEEDFSFEKKFIEIIKQITGLEEEKIKENLQITNKDLLSKLSNLFREKDFYLIGEGNNKDNNKNNIGRIRNVIECIINSAEKLLVAEEHILPHGFYMGATPISKQFQIFDIDNVSTTTFNGRRINMPDQRIGFGTYQFIFDLLLKKGMINDKHTARSNILNYISQVGQN